MVIGILKGLKPEEYSIIALTIGVLAKLKKHMERHKYRNVNGTSALFVCQYSSVCESWT